MRVAHLVCTCLIFVSTVGLAQSNPVPFVNQPLVPTSVAPGVPGFTLTVNGTGFVSGATVNWNGTALVTTFVSSSQLTATIPVANTATARTAAVTVSNPSPGGGSSGVQYFHVATPVTSFAFAGLSGVSGDFFGPVLSADFDGDGRLDAAVASFTDGSICILLGKGDGTFLSPKCSVFSSSTWDVMIAEDFNGDGKLDLAAIDSASKQLDIFLGNGDGTFQTPKTFATPHPVSIASGDFNHDGKLDLAVGNQTDLNQSGLSILLGNGDGTFQSPVAYSLGEWASVLTIGDFNADGNLDIAFFDERSFSINVLVGNGDGTFQVGTQIVLNSGSGLALATADLNGDGKLDLIVENGPTINQQSPTLSVLLGNGDGTFQPAAVYGGGRFDIAITDINADGKLDIVTLDEDHLGNAFFSLQLGNGDGTFQVPVVFPAPFSPFALAATDFNDDGLVDLSFSGENYSVFLQGSFAVASVTPGSLAFPRLAVGTTSVPMAVALTNIGTGTMVLTGNRFIGLNAVDFVVHSTTCGSTLAVNASCQINVTFTPTAAGDRSATLSIADNVPGSPQTVALNGMSEDFSMTASPTSVTVSAGQAASYALTVMPLGGFNHDVFLSCSGAPVGSICSVPNTAMLDGSASTPVNVTVKTAGTSASLTQPGSLWAVASGLAMWCGLPGLVVLSTSRIGYRNRRCQLLQVFAFLCLLSIGVTMTACGGGSANGTGGGGTPAGTYNLTVTGTFTSGSNMLTHNTNLTLVVQ
jgi:FG-GAP-like repeat